MEDKKIVIYGSGRYPKDFLYVFDHIQAAYFVDEQAHDDVRSFWELQKEAGEIFVIICKYDDREARKNLEKIGLKKGSGYAAAADLFWKLDFPIREIAEKRDIYVWGTGDVSHDFFHTFVESHPDVEIVGCVDSNPDKSGKTFFRRTIYIPDEVLEGRDNFYIIASTLYYGEIRNILLAHGKQEGKDFISSRAIHQRASWMMRETVYDVPKLDYVCPKAFQDVVLREEGTLSVCSGIRNVDQWNTPLFYSEFDRVWHSNIMKILRLSMLNGTYSFCDPQKCDLLQNCGKRNIDTDELHYCFHRTKMQIEYIAEKETLPKETIFRKENYAVQEKQYPDVVMCAFDRTCNLYCPSCRGERYAADKNKRLMLENFADRIMKELLPHVNRLKVAGDGEAFASESYKRILFDEKLAGQIGNIGILSNGALLTPHYFDRLSSLYRSIKIFISMDGCTKETAEKLRRGLDFERWMKNMKYLGQKRQEGKIDFLAFNFVVQRDNYLEMPGFVRMCLDFHADEIKFSRIFNWGGEPEEVFERISMFDTNGDMKSELAGLVENEIFKRPEVRLFKWVNW